MTPPIRRLLSRAALVAAAVPVLWLARAAWGVPTAIGAKNRTLRRAASRSPHSLDGSFHNTLQGELMVPGSAKGIARALLSKGDIGKPRGPVPLVGSTAADANDDLAVTWFGHSSVLVEIDGHRVLFDPVWGDRVSPSRRIGPRRMHPTPIPIDELPSVDAVLISHDHYDHLDLPTVRALLRTQSAPFVVPVGLADHLRRWGVPEGRIVELDWDETVHVGGLTLVCTEARHFSGRGLARNCTQWSSWAVRGPRHRVFFAGDTGYTPAFATIGSELGPFDLTLMPIGAYSEQWPAIHMNPEESVRAHQDLGGGLLVPIHWATFDLAFHPWAEPPERLVRAAKDAGARFCVPRPGQRIPVAGPPAYDDWWTAAGGAE